MKVSTNKTARFRAEVSGKLGVKLRDASATVGRGESCIAVYYTSETSDVPTRGVALAFGPAERATIIRLALHVARAWPALADEALALAGAAWPRGLCHAKCPGWFLNEDTGLVERCDECCSGLDVDDDDAAALPAARATVAAKFGDNPPRRWRVENAETGTDLGEYIAPTSAEALAMFRDDLDGEPLEPSVRAVLASEARP